MTGTSASIWITKHLDNQTIFQSNRNIFIGILLSPCFFPFPAFSSFCLYQQASESLVFTHTSSVSILSCLGEHQMYFRKILYLFLPMTLISLFLSIQFRYSYRIIGFERIKVLPSFNFFCRLNVGDI